jgi:hypothetical protein
LDAWQFNPTLKYDNIRRGISVKKLLAVLMIFVLTFVMAPSVYACTEWYPDTAWAVADSCNPKLNTLNSLDGIKANKWGWYIDVRGLNGNTAEYDIYAGAGQNNLNIF